MTDRAVSVTVNYVLTLTIATLLLSGLAVSAGGIIESQSERAIESELEVLGQQLAADIESADRLVTINENEDTTVDTVKIETRLSNQVGGTRYTIDIDSEEKRIELWTTNPEVSAFVSFSISLERSAETKQSVRGGDVLIEWDGNDTLVIESA